MAAELAEAGRPKSIKPLRRMIPFVLRYPWRLAAMMAFLLISSLSSLAIPFVSGNAIDQGLLDNNVDLIARFAWVLIVLGALIAAASAARFYFISILGERVVTDLRQAVFGHLLTLDASFYDTNRVGELTSRLNGDVAVIRSAVGATASVALRSSVMVIGSYFMMFLTNPVLTALVLIIGPVLFLPIVWFGRYVRHYSRVTRDRVADLSAMATEIFSSIKTVKSFTREPDWLDEYSIESERSYEAEGDRLLVRAALVAMTLFVGATGTVVLLWVGAVSVLNGTMSPGELVKFLLYAGMAAGALSALSEIWGTLQHIAGSTERLVELLDTKPGLKVLENPEPMPEPSLGTLAFEKVDFSYMSRDKSPVLHGMDFSVRHGETVALVGPSGAGKTTVFALVQRFYDPDKGRVMIDGVDARRVDPALLRKRVSYVEQDATMFAGSIEFNIRFGRLDATDEEVRAAAKAALVDEFADAFENGYDSLVGERGVMLSGGQRQRVAIARALLKDAPILLLDEATSALDAQSEKLVQTALARLMRGRTTLIIAHRLATIRDADRILVLDQGVLIDEGTHDELIKKGGRYADLAKLQFNA
ncbi:MAG: ATP-binding cassette domain-containing protein [Alphaproteobacteria bacterium]|nr:ATP-binding cassette domain-containing protein [Alphaproteobacteria bacterium]